jgi:hypothetical protein
LDRLTNMLATPNITRHSSEQTPNPTAPTTTK